jgi:DNA-binding GntR family transcriptional regulator
VTTHPPRSLRHAHDAATLGVALQEHQSILNALLRRDGIGLAHILRAHLRHKREEVISAGFADDCSTDINL